MTSRDFYTNVQKHADLEWLGVRELPSGVGEALVLHKKTGIKSATVVSSILAHSWKELEGVLTGKREARVMIHLTRIVGYYSRISNWNLSAKAQLRDRQKGQYALPEQISPPIDRAALRAVPARERMERVAIPA